MKKSVVILSLTVVVVVAGFFAWQNWGTDLSHTEKTAPDKNETSAAPAKSEVQFPVSAEPAAKAKENNPSDGTAATETETEDQKLHDDAGNFFGKLNVEDIVVFDDFIRHFVVTIANATEKQIPLRLSPFKSVAGDFLVTQEGEHIHISDANKERYQKYVELFQKADLPAIVGFYRHAYPRFQAAYKDLGVGGYFNDKLVAVVDNMLATPPVDGPVELKQPSVRYEYADPALQSLTAVQKIIIRMGLSRSQSFRTRLTELRGLLTHLNSAEN